MITTLSDVLLPAYVAVRCHLVCGTQRLRADQRGEGVISAAIAVLIMAFLGAAMWLAFKGMFETTTAKTNTQVEQIGS